MGPEFLEYAFMQRALVAGAVTAIVCPSIGVFLVPRRLSLIADTLAHVALAGVALGLLLGLSPILGAFAVTLVAAAGLEGLRARGALRGTPRWRCSFPEGSPSRSCSSGSVAGSPSISSRSCSAAS
jgi:ABC-type Mn2+/Zn2+ transport system permease subunit